MFQVHVAFTIPHSNSAQNFHWRYTVKVIQGGLTNHFWALLLSCFLIMSRRLAPVTRSLCVCLSFCCSFLLWSWRYGEFNSCGGRRDPVGFTCFAMSQKSLFELLLMKVIAVPCWPNRPTLPIWNEMQRTFSKCSHEILTSLERNWRLAFKEVSLRWVFVQMASAEWVLSIYLWHQLRGLPLAQPQ